MSTTTKRKRVDTRDRYPVGTLVRMPCSDCGIESEFGTEALARVGKNRDPGEAVCRSCTASRTVLVRKLMALPNSLRLIQADINRKGRK